MHVAARTASGDVMEGKYNIQNEGADTTSVSVCCDLPTKGLVNIKVPLENEGDLSVLRQKVERYLEYEADSSNIQICKALVFNTSLHRWVDLTDMSQISDKCQVFIGTSHGVDLPLSLPPPRIASLSVAEGNVQAAEEWWERAINEEPTLIILRSLVAEYVGTLIHSLLLTCCIIYASSFGGPSPAFVSGTTMAALTISFSKYSTAQLNPAVTIGMMLCKKTSLTLGCLGMLMQLLGAVTGIGLALGATPGGEESATDLFRNASLVVSTGRSFVRGHAVLGEAVSSFVISLVFLCMIKKGAKEIKTAAVELCSSKAGISIGSAYFATHAVFFPMYPSVANPARALAMAIVGQDYSEPWEEVWIFTVIPLLGGVASGAVYTVLVEGEKTKKKEGRREVGVVENVKRVPSHDDSRYKTVLLVGKDRSEIPARVSVNTTHADHMHSVEAWVGSPCWLTDEAGSLVTLTFHGVNEGARFYIHSRKEPFSASQSIIFQKRSNDSLF
eukprot:TRINITY_DN556_c0_g1_i4.p1 TRINITY_DN556_c0_g1~~TRINITY_DN556_c0_g1_i4.p1  ORF type:complete len:501 (+),score=126.33 TRINITY_DN556_c0_g1_i4:435-1937(+)